MSFKCDILVVGAGPAGCSAARASASKGAKTLIIDKKNEIGYPIQCAEGIGKYLFPYLPFTIPKDQLIWKIEGMFFWADNISTEKKGEWWKGYTIDRNKFDKWLSTLAVDQGADIWTTAELIDIEFDSEKRVKKAIVKNNKKLLEILPKVIIAADGAESTVLKLLGEYKPKAGDVADVYSWEMTNLELYKPHLEQIYMGDFSPSGYAYIFPKSKNSANFGIGHIRSKKQLDKSFDEFLDLDLVKKQVRNAEYVVEKSGKATIGNITDRWIYENVVLVGDNANHNLKPFVEGILPSVICGNVAGDIAYTMADGKSPNIHKYRDLIENILHPHFEDSNELVEILQHVYSMKDKKKHLLFYGLVSNVFEPNEIQRLGKMDYEELKSSIMEKNV